MCFYLALFLIVISNCILYHLLTKVQKYSYLSNVLKFLLQSQASSHYAQKLMHVWKVEGKDLVSKK